DHGVARRCRGGVEATAPGERCAAHQHVADARALRNGHVDVDKRARHIADVTAAQEAARLAGAGGRAAREGAVLAGTRARGAIGSSVSLPGPVCPSWTRCEALESPRQAMCS